MRTQGPARPPPDGELGSGVYSFWNTYYKNVAPTPSG